MVTYDPFSEEVMLDPHPIYKQLRDEAPVYHVERFDAWVLTRFADLWEAGASDAYSTAQGSSTAHLLTKVQPVTPMLNLLDPPEHTKLRQGVRALFSPRRVREVEPRIRQIVRDSLQKLAGRGSADLVRDFSQGVASTVAGLVSGYPVEDGEMLGELVHRFFAREAGVEGMTEDGVQAAGEMNGYFEAMVRERRAHPTSEEDVLSTMLAFEWEGQRYEDAAIASHLSLFLIGGAETFPKVFANTVYYLWKSPDQRAECVGNESLLPNAFKESLRYDMPTQVMCRSLLRDVEVHGVKMRAGRPVLLIFPSGNRDEREFSNPDVFDVKREIPRFLGFGHGTHGCLGLHVAQAEGRIALEELLRVMPEYEVVTGGLTRYRTDFVQGFATMPVEFAPAG